MSIKLAIGCSMRVGKDTAGDYLLKHLGKNSFKRLTFSKPLYDIMYYAQDLCKIPRHKDRKFLQLIGTQWAREKDSNVWINCMKKELENSNKNIIITDIRFKNEFEFCKKEGFTLIKITRNVNEISNEYESLLIKKLQQNKDLLSHTLIFAQDICGFERDYNDKLFYSIIEKYSENDSYNTRIHSSENLVNNNEIPWEYIIDNDSDITTFHKKLDDILYNIN